jgi:hypothetical protein
MSLYHWKLEYFCKTTLQGQRTLDGITKQENSVSRGRVKNRDLYFPSTTIGSSDQGLS